MRPLFSDTMEIHIPECVQIGKMAPSNKTILLYRLKTLIIFLNYILVNVSKLKCNNRKNEILLKTKCWFTAMFVK